MLQDREVNIDEFISFNSSGVVIADYDQVQAALVKRYKEIYGLDIDLANTTADGVFVNNLALIINNILQSFKLLYSNLNVDTASGDYLDSLCRLSNVTRKPATKSTAQLILSTTQDNTPIEPGIIFIDTTGNEWELLEEGLPAYQGTPILLDIGDEYVVTVTCTQTGPIEANPNSITETLEASALVISQPEAAAIGSNGETDSELRARRDQSNGSHGITVEESLIGSLLAVEGIEDAYVIDNNTDTDDENTADGTTIKAHSIYISIRRRENVQISNEIIGNIIYNTLTPGIATNAFNDDVSNEYATTGISKNMIYPLSDLVTYLQNIVYWKECVPITPIITFDIRKGRNYSESTTNAIVQDIVDYLNTIQISKVPDTNNIIITATYADPNAAYIIQDVDVSNAEVNPITYFHYINDVKEANPQHVIVEQDQSDTSLLHFTLQ